LAYKVVPVSKNRMFYHEHPIMPLHTTLFCAGGKKMNTEKWQWWVITLQLNGEV